MATKVNLEGQLARLAPSHQAALKWYFSHAGSEQPWTPTLPDGTRLATRAKGIYKPSGLDYALSVKQTLGSPYRDQQPVYREDGTWVYLYFQEGLSPDLVERDSHFTNMGLLACMRDNVPVGVMIQVSGKPSISYRIMGLALVAGWKEGFFCLEGYSLSGFSHGKPPLESTN